MSNISCVICRVILKQSTDSLIVKVMTENRLSTELQLLIELYYMCVCSECCWGSPADFMTLDNEHVTSAADQSWRPFKCSCVCWCELMCECCIRAAAFTHYQLLQETTRSVCAAAARTSYYHLFTFLRKQPTLTDSFKKKKKKNLYLSDFFTHPKFVLCI